MHETAPSCYIYSNKAKNAWAILKFSSVAITSEVTLGIDLKGIRGLKHTKRRDQ